MVDRGDVTGIVVAGKVMDLANHTATLLNHTAARVSAAVQEPAAMPDAGVPLSMMGGLLYAVGALLVSYAIRAKASGALGWTENWVRGFTVLSWVSLNTGGLCVTFAYQSGASVPLMSAVVYSTNLTLNMVFQMCFRLSVYTKTMRCGTVLFALAALQVGGLSPVPHKVDLDMLSQPAARSWNHVFLFLWIFSAVMIRHARSFASGSSLKIMAWSLHVACWGCFMDNWAKINGTFNTSSTMYWMLFTPYLAVGGFVMVLSVAAMVATDVALYVPAQLCVQLILNVLSSFLLWGEAGDVHSLMPYVVGYMICVLAVYIATPEIDVCARMADVWESTRCYRPPPVAPTPVTKPLRENLLTVDARQDAEQSSASNKVWVVV